MVAAYLDRTEGEGTDHAETSLFELWVEVPCTLQHTIAAMFLRHEGEHAHVGEAETQQPASVASDPGTSQTCISSSTSARQRDVHAVRAACRALRDGVDAAVTGVTATLPVPPTQQTMSSSGLGLHRFPRLTRLEMHLPPHRAAGRCDLAFDSPHDLPPALQELTCTGVQELLFAYHLHFPHLSHLHTLSLSYLNTQEELDCGLFPALQRLHVRCCEQLLCLLRLHTCSRLRDLELDCPALRRGLEPDTLQQLTQLERAVIGSCSCSLDTTALAPSVAHLDVSDVPNMRLTLPPNGAPRTALRHLGVHYMQNGECLDLSAAPSLEVLEMTQCSIRSLDFRAVPRLRQLTCIHSHLEEVDLTPVAHSLTALDLSVTPLNAAMLQSCTALRRITLQHCYSLRIIQLPRAGAALTALNLSSSRFFSLDLTGCTALTHLDVSGCDQLDCLDLTPVSHSLVNLDAAPASAGQPPTLHLEGLHACNKLQSLRLRCDSIS